MKMFKNLSAKQYQKRACERYQDLSKEGKEKKSNNMVVNVTRIPLKMKKKTNLLSIEKNIE